MVDERLEWLREYGIDPDSLGTTASSDHYSNQGWELCPSCDGIGKDSGTRCRSCKGTGIGRTEDLDQVEPWGSDCPTCLGKEVFTGQYEGGTGLPIWKSPDDCPSCQGEGTMHEPYRDFLQKQKAKIAAVDPDACQCGHDLLYHHGGDEGYDCDKCPGGNCKANEVGEFREYKDCMKCQGTGVSFYSPSGQPRACGDCKGSGIYRFSGKASIPSLVTGSKTRLSGERDYTYCDFCNGKGEVPSCQECMTSCSVRDGCHCTYCDEDGPIVRCNWCRGTGLVEEQNKFNSGPRRRHAKTRLVMPARCPSCDSSETRGRYHRGGWREYTCLDCGSEFKNRDSKIAQIGEWQVCRSCHGGGCKDCRGSGLQGSGHGDEELIATATCKCGGPIIHFDGGWVHTAEEGKPMCNGGSPSAGTIQMVASNWAPEDLITNVCRKCKGTGESHSIEQKQKPCAPCKGSGLERACPDCGGLMYEIGGEVRHLNYKCGAPLTNPAKPLADPCPDCPGTGLVNGNICDTCSGTGVRRTPASGMSFSTCWACGGLGQVLRGLPLRSRTCKVCKASGLLNSCSSCGKAIHKVDVKGTPFDTADGVKWMHDWYEHEEACGIRYMKQADRILEHNVAEDGTVYQRVVRESDVCYFCKGEGFHLAPLDKLMGKEPEICVGCKGSGLTAPMEVQQWTHKGPVTDGWSPFKDLDDRNRMKKQASSWPSPFSIEQADFSSCSVCESAGGISPNCRYCGGSGIVSENSMSDNLLMEYWADDNLQRQSSRRSGPKITFVRGDITQQDTDAIVNAANEQLLGGGGVDGAIHQAAGPELLEYCKALRETDYPDGLQAGQAVVTPGGDLPAKYVIHAVGPRYKDHPNPEEALRSAHTEALKRADEVGARSVSFPAISTGIFGYPLEEASRVAVDAVRGAGTNVEEVRFVSFDDETHGAFSRHAHKVCDVCTQGNHYDCIERKSDDTCGCYCHNPGHPPWMHDYLDYLVGETNKEKVGGLSWDFGAAKVKVCEVCEGTGGGDRPCTYCKGSGLVNEDVMSDDKLMAYWSDTNLQARGHAGDDQAAHHSNPDKLRQDHPYWDTCPDCGGDGIGIGSTDVNTGEQKQKPCATCKGIGEDHDFEYWDSDDQMHDFSNYPNFKEMSIPDKELKKHLKDTHEQDQYEDSYSHHQNIHGINVDPAIAEVLIKGKDPKQVEGAVGPRWEACWGCDGSGVSPQKVREDEYPAHEFEPRARTMWSPRGTPRIIQLTLAMCRAKMPNGQECQFGSRFEAHDNYMCSDCHGAGIYFEKGMTKKKAGRTAGLAYEICRYCKGSGTSVVSITGKPDGRCEACKGSGLWETGTHECAECGADLIPGRENEPCPSGYDESDKHVPVEKTAFIKEAPYGMPKDIGGDTPEIDARMERCVKKVMAEGHDKESAIRICKDSITKKERKSAVTPVGGSIGPEECANCGKEIWSNEENPAGFWMHQALGNDDIGSQFCNPGDNYENGGLPLEQRQIATPVGGDMRFAPDNRFEECPGCEGTGNGAKSFGQPIQSCTYCKGSGLRPTTKYPDKSKVWSKVSQKEYPDQVRLDTNRKTINDMKKINEALLDKATEKALGEGDDHILDLVKNLHPHKLTPSDKGTLNSYLYGDPQGIVQSRVSHEETRPGNFHQHQDGFVECDNCDGSGVLKDTCGHLPHEGPCPGYAKCGCDGCTDEGHPCGECNGSGLATKWGPEHSKQAHEDVLDHFHDPENDAPEYFLPESEKGVEAPEAKDPSKWCEECGGNGIGLDFGVCKTCKGFGSPRNAKIAEFTPGDTTYPFAETQTPNFAPQPRGEDPWQDKGDNGLPLHNPGLKKKLKRPMVTDEQTTGLGEINYPGGGLMSEASVAIQCGYCDGGGKDALDETCSMCKGSGLRYVGPDPEQSPGFEKLKDHMEGSHQRQVRQADPGMSYEEMQGWHDELTERAPSGKTHKHGSKQLDVCHFCYGSGVCADGACEKERHPDQAHPCEFCKGSGLRQGCVGCGNQMLLPGWESGTYYCDSCDQQRSSSRKRPAYMYATDDGSHQVIMSDSGNGGCSCGWVPPDHKPFDGSKFKLCGACEGTGGVSGGASCKHCKGSGLENNNLVPYRAQEKLDLGADHIRAALPKTVYRQGLEDHFAESHGHQVGDKDRTPDEAQRGRDFAEYFITDGVVTKMHEGLHARDKCKFCKGTGECTDDIRLRRKDHGEGSPEYPQMPEETQIEKLKAHTLCGGTKVCHMCNGQGHVGIAAGHEHEGIKTSSSEDSYVACPAHGKPVVGEHGQEAFPEGHGNPDRSYDPGAPRPSNGWYPHEVVMHLKASHGWTGDDVASTYYETRGFGSKQLNDAHRVGHGHDPVGGSCSICKGTGLVGTWSRLRQAGRRKWETWHGDLVKGEPLCDYCSHPAGLHSMVDDDRCSGGGGKDGRCNCLNGYKLDPMGEWATKRENTPLEGFRSLHYDVEPDEYDWEDEDQWAGLGSVDPDEYRQCGACQGKGCDNCKNSGLMTKPTEDEQSPVFRDPGRDYALPHLKVYKKAQTWSQGEDTPPNGGNVKRKPYDPWPNEGESHTLVLPPASGEDIKKWKTIKTFPGDKPFANHPQNQDELHREQVVGAYQRKTKDCVSCGKRIHGNDYPLDSSDASLVAEEYNMEGPDIPQCFSCANDEGTYHRMMAKNGPHRYWDFCHTCDGDAQVRGCQTHAAFGGAKQDHCRGVSRLYEGQDACRLGDETFKCPECKGSGLYLWGRESAVRYEKWARVTNLDKLRPADKQFATCLICNGKGVWPEGDVCDPCKGSGLESPCEECGHRQHWGSDWWSECKPLSGECGCRAGEERWFPVTTGRLSKVSASKQLFSQKARPKEIQPTGEPTPIMRVVHKDKAADGDEASQKVADYLKAVGWTDVDVKGSGKNEGGHWVVNLTANPPKREAVASEQVLESEICESCEGAGEYWDDNGFVQCKNCDGPFKELYARCRACEGTGTGPSWDNGVCSMCKGSGLQAPLVVRRAKGFYRPCDWCGGRGTNKDCLSCSGLGEIKDTSSYEWSMQQDDATLLQHLLSGHFEDQDEEVIEGWHELNRDTLSQVHDLNHEGDSGMSYGSDTHSHGFANCFECAGIGANPEPNDRCQYCGGSGMNTADELGITGKVAGVPCLCKGTGLTNLCGTCGGSGTVFTFPQECPECKGFGKTDMRLCEWCEGTGTRKYATTTPTPGYNPYPKSKSPYDCKGCDRSVWDEPSTTCGVSGKRPGAAHFHEVIPDGVLNDMRGIMQKGREQSVPAAHRYRGHSPMRLRVEGKDYDLHVQCDGKGCKGCRNSGLVRSTTLTEPEHETIELGKNDRGERVLAHLELRPPQGVGSKMTTEHKPVTDDMVDFSLTGTILPRGWRPGWDIAGGGAMGGSFSKEVSKPAPGIDRGFIKHIDDLDRYHLNNMKSHCAHQGWEWDCSSCGTHNDPYPDRKQSAKGDPACSTCKGTGIVMEFPDADDPRWETDEEVNEEYQACPDCKGKALIHLKFKEGQPVLLHGEPGTVTKAEVQDNKPSYVITDAKGKGWRARDHHLKRVPRQKKADVKMRKDAQFEACPNCGGSAKATKCDYCMGGGKVVHWVARHHDTVNCPNERCKDTHYGPPVDCGKCGGTGIGRECIHCKSTGIINKQALFNPGSGSSYDPVRDVSPSGRSAPAPRAQGQSGDPWIDQGDNGTAPPRPGLIFDPKLKKWVRDLQGTYPEIGPTFPGVTDINKVGQQDEVLCPQCGGGGCRWCKGSGIGRKSEQFTCEDRGWECCESLSPAEHKAQFGYTASGQEHLAHDLEGCKSCGSTGRSLWTDVEGEICGRCKGSGLDQPGEMRDHLWEEHGDIDAGWVDQVNPDDVESLNRAHQDAHNDRICQECLYPQFAHDDDPEDPPDHSFTKQSKVAAAMVTCGHCGGTGKFVNDKCKFCKGSGLEPDNSDMSQIAEFKCAECGTHYDDQDHDWDEGDLYCPGCGSNYETDGIRQVPKTSHKQQGFIACWNHDADGSVRHPGWRGNFKCPQCKDSGLVPDNSMNHALGHLREKGYPVGLRSYDTRRHIDIPYEGIDDPVKSTLRDYDNSKIIEDSHEAGLQFGHSDSGWYCRAYRGVPGGDGYNDSYHDADREGFPHLGDCGEDHKNHYEDFNPHHFVKFVDKMNDIYKEEFNGPKYESPNKVGEYEAKVAHFDYCPHCGSTPRVGCELCKGSGLSTEHAQDQLMSYHSEGLHDSDPHRSCPYCEENRRFARPAYNWVRWYEDREDGRYLVTAGACPTHAREKADLPGFAKIRTHGAKQCHFCGEASPVNEVKVGKIEDEWYPNKDPETGKKMAVQPCPQCEGTTVDTHGAVPQACTFCQGSGLVNYLNTGLLQRMRERPGGEAMEERYRSKFATSYGTVTGYTYDADTHCIGCAYDRFDDPDKLKPEGWAHCPSCGGTGEGTPGRACSGCKGSGLSFSPEGYPKDSEGNEVHPIFAGDEYDTPANCGTCRNNFCTSCGSEGVEAKTRDECEDCEGSGKHWADESKPCDGCEGDGYHENVFECGNCGIKTQYDEGSGSMTFLSQVKLAEIEWGKCPQCSGTGELSSKMCYKCKGSGLMNSTGTFGITWGAEDHSIAQTGYVFNTLEDAWSAASKGPNKQSTQIDGMCDHADHTGDVWGTIEDEDSSYGSVRVAQVLPQQVGDHEADNGIDDPMKRGDRDKAKKILPGTQKSLPGNDAMNVSIDNLPKTGSDLNRIPEGVPAEEELSDLGQHLVRTHDFPIEMVGDPEMYNDAELDEIHLDDHIKGVNDHNPEVLRVARKQ